MSISPDFGVEHSSAGVMLGKSNPLQGRAEMGMHAMAHLNLYQALNIVMDGLGGLHAQHIQTKISLPLC